MKPTVYIETSIVSYLAAKPSNDIRAAACQAIAAECRDSGYEPPVICTPSELLEE